jgi:hypothetical protein
LKVVNYGTGLGKSYAFIEAACQTINQTPPGQRAIVFYIAPLREHLKIDPTLREKYPHVPIFTLASLEMKTTNENLQAYLRLCSTIRRSGKFGRTSRLKKLPSSLSA